MTKDLEMKLRDKIEEGILLEVLEEVGYTKLDYLSDFMVDNLDELINILDKDYNLPCIVSNDLRGHVLENEHYTINQY